MQSFKLKERVDPTIFRAYDIRGTTPHQLDGDTVFTIGLALGSLLVSKNIRDFIVARDGRISSPLFAKALIEGLRSTGINVTDIGVCTSPLLYFATSQSASKSGVIITGSHNPKEDNGFKIVVAGKSLTEQELQTLYQSIQAQCFCSGNGLLESSSYHQAYVEAINERIQIPKKLKVVIDCGNGAAGVIAREVFESLGAEIIVLFEEVDGNFPNHQPDPSVDKNLLDLKRAVLEEQADLGLAFDGDADRIGVIDEKGQAIYSDRLLMLLSETLLKESPAASIVYDIKCSNLLPQLIKTCGGVPVLSPTGHSLVKAKMKALGAALAGEMSGHIFYHHRWFGFDDGIYTGARLLEIVSGRDKPLSELMQFYPEMLSTPEIKIAIAKEKKFSIISQIESHLKCVVDATLTTIDGVRIDYSDGWALVRASNTTEHLTLRFEARTKSRLNFLITLLKEAIQTAEQSLDLAELA